ncbi:MAG: polyprenyl diphosphate synthase [Candidatus Melainabacteria bacterium]
MPVADVQPTETMKTLLTEQGPRHIAIIMDGNRRWAKDRGLPTLAGHQAGVTALKTIVRYAGDMGLTALTVFAFSTENWKRTEDEVGYLMTLFVEALSQEIQALHRNGVRLTFIGDLPGLPPRLQKAMAAAMALTAGNTGLRFQVAFNYGGRAEIVQAARALASEVAAGRLDPAAIDEDMLASRLYTADLPGLDLLIRTGGEYRISNYLLWQAAYAELYTTEALWPAFDEAALDAAIAEYHARQRRFGK